MRKLTIVGLVVTIFVGGILAGALMFGSDSPTAEKNVVHASAPSAPRIKAFARCDDGSIKQGNLAFIPRDGIATSLTTPACPGNVTSCMYTVFPNTARVFVTSNVVDSLGNPKTCTAVGHVAAKPDNTP